MNEITVGILPTTREVAMSGVDSQEIALPDEPDERGASESFLAEYGIKLDETHLELPPDLDFEDFTSVCARLNRFSRAMPWYIGDALLHGERAYGDAYYQASAEFDMRPETLMNYVSICRWVPPEVRRADLGFTHHAPIAKLRKSGRKRSDPAVPDVKTQRYWLELAVEKRWNRDELREAIAAAGAGQNTAANAEVRPPPEQEPSRSVDEESAIPEALPAAPHGSPEIVEVTEDTASEALREILASAVPAATVVAEPWAYCGVSREALTSAARLLGLDTPLAWLPPASDDDLDFSPRSIDEGVTRGSLAP